MEIRWDVHVPQASVAVENVAQVCTHTHRAAPPISLRTPAAHIPQSDAATRTAPVRSLTRSCVLHTSAFDPVGQIPHQQRARLVAIPPAATTTAATPRRTTVAVAAATAAAVPRTFAVAVP
jgi:hypothetical protein